MSNSDELEGFEGGKAISVKFTRRGYTMMYTLAKELGYPNTSEFIRESVRDKCLALTGGSQKHVIDFLLATGKVTPADILDALGTAGWKRD